MSDSEDDFSAYEQQGSAEQAAMFSAEHDDPLAYKGPAPANQENDGPGKVLSWEEYQICTEDFAKQDTDGSGAIDYEEFQAMICTQCDVNSTFESPAHFNQLVGDMFYGMDKDHNGKIELFEFLTSTYGANWCVEDHEWVGKSPTGLAQYAYDLVSPPEYGIVNDGYMSRKTAVDLVGQVFEFMQENCQMDKGVEADESMPDALFVDQDLVNLEDLTAAFLWVHKTYGR